MDFEHQFAAIRPLLYQTALKLTESTEDAEDLVQDTALQAFESRQARDPSRSFIQWCLSIMENARLDDLRKIARRVQCKPLSEVRSESSSLCSDPESQIVSRLLVESIWKSAANRLSGPQLDTLEKLYEGKSPEEVADAMDQTKNLARVRICRIRQRLKIAAEQL